ncbi:MAG: PIG-L family deacetylase [Bacteroidetes bacterium]|nr:PIG-L family deacetylase [Bacteroidota bacterium]
METTKNRILVLAPHTDDGELGCGGTIAKFIEEGKEVFYAAFSTAKESLPQGMPDDTLETEVKEATLRLGIPDSHLIIHGYTVRKLNYSRQNVLEDMIRMKREINPDLVFMPSPNDLHQDHNTVAMESMRAYKDLSILAYELPWNNINFNTQAFVKLEKRHIEKKAHALEAYASQMKRSYLNREFIFSWAMTRGVQIKTVYAETFEVIRWII